MSSNTMNAATPTAGFDARLIWGLARTPALLMLAYLLRIQILDLLERTVDISWTTAHIVDVASTPLSRLILLIGIAACLWIIARISSRLGAVRGYLASLAASAVLVFAVVIATQGGLKWAAGAVVMVALNWAPDEVWTPLRVKMSWLDRFVAAVPIAPEVLLADRYWAWLRRAPHKRTPLFGAVLTAAMLALFVNGGAYVPLERAMRAGDASIQFARGDYNGLELSADGRYLYASGHGVNYIQRFDVANLNAPPLQSALVPGGAQALEYDANSREIYYFRDADKTLVSLDADTLQQKRAAPLPDMSPGDTWIEHDPRTDTLTIASEADVVTGHPFQVVDRLTGRVLYKRDEAPGNLALDPQASIVYLSFFRKGQGAVESYDIATNRMIAHGQCDPRMERLIYDPVRDEVLATSPVESRVLLYDARTLQPRGMIHAMLGVRTLAIDQERHILLAGSIATGTVAAIDLNTDRTLRTWYLGTWLRSIVLAPEHGVAYVSSNGALYRLTYAH